MPTFSKTSLQRLATCDTRLQDLCLQAINLFDFTVIEGHRDASKQQALFDQGLSKARPGQSKHNVYPSMAVDLAPYPIDWQDKERFRYLGGIMVGLAYKMAIPLRWGGDWDGDGVFVDQSLIDLPHFELKG